MSVAPFTVPPIVKTVVVRAAPQRAFEMFACELARWWPLAQFHTGPDPVDCTIEPRAGGRVFERAKDGRETSWGTVLAYDPPGRLAFTWIVGLSADTPQEVEVRFTPESGGTRVELTHSGWEKLGEAALDLRGRYEQGWGALVESFYADYANTAA